MFEQWHPLGVVGVISAFNFPVAVWSWNAAIAAVCGDATLWKPSSQTPLTAIACTRIAGEVCARERLRSGHLLPGGGAGLHRGRPASARPPHPAGIRHRQLPDGLPGGSGGGQAAGPHHSRAGRQQRHHRNPARQHGPCASRHPVRIGGHGRAALHQHAPHHRARVHPRGAGAAAGVRPTGTCASATRAPRRR